MIRKAGSDTSDVVEAVSGPYMLVENGQIVPGLDQGDRMPRNSVGIRADGSVVFFEADGRQEPMSIGMSMYEVASFLKDAGCVTAIYLDGGGSAARLGRGRGVECCVDGLRTRRRRLRRGRDGRWRDGGRNGDKPTLPANASR